MSFLAPCPRHKPTEIALPDGCRVPHGALNKSSKGGQLLRSTSATPLPHQLEWFKREATLVSAELDDEEAVTLRRCFHDGIFTQSNYARSAGQHPADITGLAFAGSLVQMQHGAVLECASLVPSATQIPRAGRTLRLGAYYLAPGGRRRRCRGGGELPVANVRLTVQDGGSRPRSCSNVPL